ncbi:MAG: hypothetical protein G01um101438_1034, partial [Parcubacteria group bacterium Gr01-1014_38]
TADVNGDGKADVVGREHDAGNWWVGISTGTSFTNALWGHWNPEANWLDVKAADVTGDGMADIVGRVQQDGNWWVGVSTGSGFTNQHWGRWDTVAWRNVGVGTISCEGDRREDVVGRHPVTGEWAVAISTGTSFVTETWGAWDPAIMAHKVFIANVNGDLTDDLVRSLLSTRIWEVAVSTCDEPPPPPPGY